MTVADEIAKLKELHAAGTLSDAEFEAAKAKALRGGEPGVLGGILLGIGSGLGWWAATAIVAAILLGAAYLFGDADSATVELLGVAILVVFAGALSLGRFSDSLDPAPLALGGTMLVACAGIAGAVFALPLLLVLAPILLIGAVVAFFGGMFGGE